MSLPTFLPGMRVVIRDAEWIIRSVERSSDGGHVLGCDGISELVRGSSAMFLTQLEQQFDPIQILQPEQTQLIRDLSPGFRQALLYTETCLRRTAPNDAAIHVAHQAAMNLLGYQLEPALQALNQPRQRILIADAVGLGKTLEAGILVSELIHRGKGKRILVLSLKSMLTQFQKEFWNRFSIPLTRLDSIGLARVRNHIPTNHNPFHYYDKSIISIDTLKNNLEYRAYLENAKWDIIIIDEAHNVAERGSRSQRSRLARLLATRSDTLIMLSATPHDGRAKSFASLINMLDPTAISDPEHYSPEDYLHKGLVMRRFKKDIQFEAGDHFPERQVSLLKHDASPQEEAAYAALLAVPFSTSGNGPDALVRITLQKALFSSPRAAWESVRMRMRRQRDRRLKAAAASHHAIDQELQGLEQLSLCLDDISPQNFARYQALLQLLKDRKHYRWSPKDPGDRIVIFTERVATLQFLKDNLIADLGLKENQIALMKGSEMSDHELQTIVEAFGRQNENVRILLATDVASEGINLHYLCHRLIHFDLPWSLMSFQQRNGRIDRYGQKNRPLITYLCTNAAHPTIRGDQRILEVLVAKDQKAYEDIGDPQVFMGVYDIQAETELTMKAMAQHMDETTFDRTYSGNLDPNAADDGEALLRMFQISASTPLQAQALKTDPRAAISASTGLFPSDAAYARAALEELQKHQPQLSAAWRDQGRTLTLQMPADLRARFSRFPKEIQPEDGRLELTEDMAAVVAEMERCRQDESAWPKLHYLWAQHPVLRWLDDRMAASFGRHTAPVLLTLDPLQPDQTVFVINAVIPNDLGHPLLQNWYAIHFQGDRHQATEPFADLARRLPLAALSNPGHEHKHALKRPQALLAEAVAHANSHLRHAFMDFTLATEQRVQERLQELDHSLARQLRAYEARLDDARANPNQREHKLREHRQHLETVFTDARTWIQNSFGSTGKAFIQVISVLHRPQD